MEIPKEGFCKTRKREIIQFFKNLYPDCKERLQVEHIGIAWNKGSFWFIKEHSFKPLISEELLLNIIQLKVGKWYKINNNDIAKFHHLKEDKFYAVDWISNGKFASFEKPVWNFFNYLIPISIEEVRQYLPDGHPDKLSKLLTIDDLVEGDVYYCLNNTICKWGKNDSTHSINIEKKDFWYNKSGAYTGQYGFRLATTEEKHWLLTCIEQGKFIPKEELDKYDSEGNLIEVKQQFKVGDWVYADRQSEGDFRYELGDSYIPIFKVEEIYKFSAVSIWLRPIKNKANGIESKYCRLATPEEIAKVNKPVDKPTFEFNKWYKLNNGDGLFFVKSKNTGYGFRSNHKNYWFVRTPDMGNWDLNNLIPAEDSEVKERLLNYAKEKYPIGTMFNSTGGYVNCIITKESSYIIEYDGDIKIRNNNNLIGRVFSSHLSKWAEIISTPETVKKEFDRNWYVEVSSQEEADKVFDWLEARGENTFRGHAYFSKTSKYIRQWNNTESKYHNKWFLSSVKHNKPQKQLSDILPEYKQSIKTEEELSYIIDTNEDLRNEIQGLINQRDFAEPIIIKNKNRKRNKLIIVNN